MIGQRLKTSPRNNDKYKKNGFISEKRYSYGREKTSLTSTYTSHENQTTRSKNEERMWREFNQHFQDTKRRPGYENHQDFVRNHVSRSNLDRGQNIFQVSQQAEILLDHNHMKRK